MLKFLGRHGVDLLHGNAKGRYTILRIFLLRVDGALNSGSGRVLSLIQIKNKVITVDIAQFVSFDMVLSFSSPNFWFLKEK